MKFSNMDDMKAHKKNGDCAEKVKLNKKRDASAAADDKWIIIDKQDLAKVRAQHKVKRAHRTTAPGRNTMGDRLKESGEDSMSIYQSPGTSNSSYLHKNSAEASQSPPLHIPNQQVEGLPPSDMISIQHSDDVDTNSGTSHAQTVDYVRLSDSSHDVASASNAAHVSQSALRVANFPQSLDTGFPASLPSHHVLHGTSPTQLASTSLPTSTAVNSGNVASQVTISQVSPQAGDSVGIPDIAMSTLQTHSPDGTSFASAFGQLNTAESRDSSLQQSLYGNTDCLTESPPRIDSDLGLDMCQDDFSQSVPSVGQQVSRVTTSTLSNAHLLNLSRATAAIQVGMSEGAVLNEVPGSNLYTLRGLSAGGLSQGEDGTISEKLIHTNVDALLSLAHESAKANSNLAPDCLTLAGTYASLLPPTEFQPCHHNSGAVAAPSCAQTSAAPVCSAQTESLQLEGTPFSVVHDSTNKREDLTTEYLTLASTSTSLHVSAATQPGSQSAGSVLSLSYPPTSVPKVDALQIESLQFDAPLVSQAHTSPGASSNVIPECLPLIDASIRMASPPVALQLSHQRAELYCTHTYVPQVDSSHVDALCLDASSLSFPSIAQSTLTSSSVPVGYGSSGIGNTYSLVSSAALAPNSLSNFSTSQMPADSESCMPPSSLLPNCNTSIQAQINASELLLDHDISNLGSSISSERKHFSSEEISLDTHLASHKPNESHLGFPQPASLTDGLMDSTTSGLTHNDPGLSHEATPETEHVAIGDLTSAVLSDTVTFRDSHHAGGMTTVSRVSTPHDRSTHDASFGRRKVSLSHSLSFVATSGDFVPEHSTDSFASGVDDLQLAC